MKVYEDINENFLFYLSLPSLSRAPCYTQNMQHKMPRCSNKSDQWLHQPDVSQKFNVAPYR